MLLGGTLKQVLDREKTLPPGALRAVARRVLLGLRNMRASAGLHHADVKPANIGLLQSGDYESTVLMDFGSALPLGATHITCPMTLTVLSYKAYLGECSCHPRSKLSTVVRHSWPGSFRP